MAQYNWTDYKNDASIFINKFQNEFNCCGGSKGFKDWIQYRPDNVPFGGFPITCCALHFDPDMKLLWCSYQDVETKVR